VERVLSFKIFDWLNEIGLPQYAEAFLAQDLDYLSVSELTDADLKELGVSTIGHRKTILREAAKLGALTSDSLPHPVLVPAPGLHRLSPGDPTPHPEGVKTRKLFLSYGHDDYTVEVVAIRDALRARGHEVWFDGEELTTGLDWEQRIEKGLTWCDCVVLTMTTYSVRRPDGYCLNEIAKALELRKPIIPILLMDVPQGAPTSICRVQYLDWRDAVPAVERSERFKQRVERLWQAIEEDKLDFEGGQQRLVRYLQPINFDGDLQRHVASFKGRAQLEARIREWLIDPAADQILWLTAAPGLGKSAVAATLAHRWAEVAAVHFCVAGQSDKTNPARAILSIAYQLSQRHDLSLYAARLSGIDLEREGVKDARTLFDALLVGPFAKEFPAPREPLLVVLDGLDEATQAGGENPLAEIVAADWSRLPPWLRLMVSSRPEAELVQWLSGRQRIELRAEDAEQQADLAAYLRERLTAVGRPPSEGVLLQILDRSEGAFHYAAMLVEEVRQGRCDPDNPVDLPAGLNPFYLQTFRRRFEDLRAYRAQTRPLLDLILATPEPVPIAVLAGVVKRDPRDVRDDLRALGSMVALEPSLDKDDSDWDTVRLSHASLRGWLIGFDATRQSLAGAYAAKPDVKALAAEVLSLWELGNQPDNELQDTTIERKTFVARTLWTLLRAAKAEEALGRVALDLSCYWEGRQLALAIEPGDFAAAKAWTPSEGDATSLAHRAKCLLHLGNLKSALGQSSLALESYKQSQIIYEEAIKLDPNNERLLNGLSTCYNFMGRALRDQGDLQGALAKYRKIEVLAKGLSIRDPANPKWKVGLGTTYGLIGQVLEHQGDLSGALKEFRKGLGLVKIATAHPQRKAIWLIEEGIKHQHIGNVFRKLGDLPSALAAFQSYRQICDQVVSLDPQLETLQFHLATSHGHLGAILLQMGDLSTALIESRKCLEIFDGLVRQDPLNASMQDWLAQSSVVVSSILDEQGEGMAAADGYEKAMTAFSKLIDIDPNNIKHQRARGYCDLLIAWIQIGSGNCEMAQTSTRRARDTFRRLLDSGVPRTIVDLAVATAVAGEAEERLGLVDAAAELDGELLALDLPAEGITNINSRLIHVIFLRLIKLSDEVCCERQAQTVCQAIRLGMKLSIEMAPLKQRARVLIASLFPGHQLVKDLQTLSD
jgi:tetratricopeptide (TPR) repeat protein